MNNIVVYIGSFNPITKAHVDLMNKSMDLVDARLGLFIATNELYLRLKMTKDNSFYFSGNARAKMINKVCKSNPKMEFYGYELGGLSPNRNKTLMDIAKEFKDDQVYFVLGADKLHTIGKTANGLKVLEKVKNIVFDRDGIDSVQYVNNSSILKDYTSQFVFAGKLEDYENVSSTLIRKMFLENQDYSEYVPMGVKEIMEKSNVVTLSDDLALRVEAEYSRGSYGASSGNKLVYEDNIRVFDDWAKGIDPYHFGNRDEFLANAKVYKDEFDVNDVKETYDTKIGCINEDCMIIAQDLVNKNYNPVILNLASRTNACGGYDKGSSAQEESLCRCSNLSASLYQFQSPIGKNGKLLNRYAKANVKYNPMNGGYPLDLNFGAVYTPNVTFFRSTVKKFFRPLSKPFKCGVVSVAALSFRDNFRFSCDDETCYRDDKTGGFTAEGNEIQLNKMRTILRVALANHHDSIILGAFGCGAFELPVCGVVNQFKTVLEEKEFKNKFKVICFAILAGPRSNAKFKPFYDEFGTYKM